MATSASSLTLLGASPLMIAYASSDVSERRVEHVQE
jgi:hypothetical protein